MNKSTPEVVPPRMNGASIGGGRGGLADCMHSSPSQRAFDCAEEKNSWKGRHLNSSLACKKGARFKRFRKNASNNTTSTELKLGER